MQEFVTGIQVIELSFVGLAWLLFILIFLLRKKPSQTPETVRDRRWLAGLFLQILGYGVVRLGQRARPSALLNLGLIAELVTMLAALAILAGSLYLTYAAVQTLGKEWSLIARLTEEHQLATGGPYRLVRHPIYTGMLGMLVGTAIAISQWQALLIGTAVFLLGTLWRIRLEEQLLVRAFGDIYRNYVREVPALIPLWQVRAQGGRK